MIEIFGLTVSGATILMFMGWAGTGAYQTFTLGRKAERAKADSEQVRRELDGSKADILGLRKDVDAQAAAGAGSVALLRDQFAEHRQSISERYATRETVDAIERRLTSSQDRILDRLDQISSRLESLGGDLVKALGAVRRS